jgi:uncharacterized protein (TIGR02757 family)
MQALVNLPMLLNALDAATPGEARLARDPLGAVRAWPEAADREVFAFYAAGLAFGRVDLFLPVLGVIADRMRRAGGPSAFLDHPHRAGAFADVVYRWVRPADLEALADGLARTRRRYGTLEAAFGAPDAPTRDRLAVGMRRLREAASPDGPPSRALKHLLPDVGGASASKRAWLLLRWLVRPDDGVDLGLWTTFSTAGLQMPVDVHVGRVGWLLGLLDRPEPSARASLQLTASLRRWRPDDPVAWDFAIAHVGITSGCTGRADPTTCLPCSVRTACREGRTLGSGGAPGGSSGSGGSPRVGRVPAAP